VFYLDTSHEDQLSFSQISLEIIEVSPQQLLVLQTDETGSSHETGHIQKQFNLQLEQQEEVFIYYFHDPMVDYLESLSSAHVKPLFFSGCWFSCLFELHFSMPWIPSFFLSRSRVSLVN